MVLGGWLFVMHCSCQLLVVLAVLGSGFVRFAWFIRLVFYFWGVFFASVSNGFVAFAHLDMDIVT